MKHKWKLIKENYWQCVNCGMDRERHCIGRFPHMEYFIDKKHSFRHVMPCRPKKEGTLKIDFNNG